MQPAQPQFLRPRQVAARLNLSRSTLWKWGKEGRFPQPFKLGPKAVGYKTADIEEWESSRSEQVQ